MIVTASKISPEDIRGAIARSGIPAYVIAGRARVNPIRLSRIMNGHVHITDDIAARILMAVQQEKEAAHVR